MINSSRVSRILSDKEYSKRFIKLTKENSLFDPYFFFILSTFYLFEPGSLVEIPI